MLRNAGVGLLAVVLGACKTVTVGQAPASIAPISLFGPVIGVEVIAGRVDDGDVVLLAGGMDLIRIDVDQGRAERTRLALAPGESCWGLARLANGALWTLKGRRSLARLAADGRLVEEVPLAAPLFGIFAAGDRLLYQEATFTPPSPALQTESS